MDAKQAERMAMNLARGTIKPYWVVENNGKFYAIEKPWWAPRDVLVRTLNHFLAGIGATIKCEFDHTGRRIEI